MASPGMGERTDDDSTKVTEPPAARSAHDLTCDPDRAEEHGVEGAFPVGVRRARHRADRRAPHRDQRPVEPAEGVVGGRDQPARRRRVAVVGGHGKCAVTELGHRSVEALAVAAREHHPGAVGDQAVGGRPAEPASAPGDEIDTVLQLEVHAPRG